jgi:hypothetical protein
MLFSNTQHTQIVVEPFVFSIELVTDQPVELKLSVDSVIELEETHALHIICNSSAQQSFTLQQLSIRWDVPAVDIHRFMSGTPSPEELAKLPYWNENKWV